MNFEDQPLRHPRDIYCQVVCRTIRLAIEALGYADEDFTIAFIASDCIISDAARSIRAVFESIADDRRLTTGERVLIIGSLLQGHSARILRKEQRGS